MLKKYVRRFTLIPLMLMTLPIALPMLWIMTADDFTLKLCIKYCIEEFKENWR